jgi:acetyltransferase-like isoleucine patch superfamily enzyme
MDKKPPFPPSPLDGLHWTLECAFRKLHIGLFSFFYRNWLRLRGARIGRGVKFEGRVLLKGAHRVKIGAGTVVGRLTQLDTLCDGYIVIGEYSFIGHFSIITADHEVIIGDRVLLSPSCFITDANHSVYGKAPIIDLPPGFQGDVQIDRGVWLGTMVVVTAGVHIGEGAVVGASAFVNHDIPAFSIAAGQPARVVKMREEVTSA